VHLTHLLFRRSIFDNPLNLIGHIRVEYVINCFLFRKVNGTLIVILEKSVIGHSTLIRILQVRRQKTGVHIMVIVAVRVFTAVETLLELNGTLTAVLLL